MIFLVILLFYLNVSITVFLAGKIRLELLKLNATNNLNKKRTALIDGKKKANDWLKNYMLWPVLFAKHLNEKRKNK